eukprot:3056091-Prymnesium_polylepis.1
METVGLHAIFASHSSRLHSSLRLPAAHGLGGLERPCRFPLAEKNGVRWSAPTVGPRWRCVAPWPDASSPY